MRKYGKFSTGPAHVFNPVPMTHEECVQHGNALAASGNYPVGTDDCFNVGISGGCGAACCAFINGECKEPQEIPVQDVRDAHGEHADEILALYQCFAKELEKRGPAHD